MCSRVLMSWSFLGFRAYAHNSTAVAPRQGACARTFLLRSSRGCRRREGAGLGVRTPGARRGGPPPRARAGRGRNAVVLVRRAARAELRPRTPPADDRTRRQGRAQPGAGQPGRRRARAGGPRPPGAQPRRRALAAGRRHRRGPGPPAGGGADLPRRDRAAFRHVPRRRRGPRDRHGAVPGRRGPADPRRPPAVLTPGWIRRKGVTARPASRDRARDGPTTARHTEPVQHADGRGAAGAQDVAGRPPGHAHAAAPTGGAPRAEGVADVAARGLLPAGGVPVTVALTP